jgi:hypothetical protein
VRFEQIAKHRPGGRGSPCIFPTDEEAAQALLASAEIKSGMRAIRLPDGKVAIFRSASKKPGTMGFDLWHGGWEANANELEQIGDRPLPCVSPNTEEGLPT